MLKNDDARSKHGENWKINNKIIICKISEQGIILEKTALSNSRNEKNQSVVYSFPKLAS